MTAIEWPLLKGFIFQDSSHASIVSPQKTITFCSFVFSLQGTTCYYEDNSKAWCMKELQAPALPQLQSVLQSFCVLTSIYKSNHAGLSQS